MIQPAHLLAGAALGAAFGAAFVQERRMRRRAERFAAASLESLLRAIDANDEQTGAHVRRVAAYSQVIAEAMGLSERQKRTIELSALFHDIGKIHEALFDIVHEHRKLTQAERRAIVTHPQRGADVLAPIAHFHPELAKAVLSHHERWDGSGYPRGLRGRQIPLAARVVAIADTFDAIIHARRYSHGRSVTAAAEIILQGRGTQFDPMIVDLVMLPPIVEQMVRAQRGVTRNTDLLQRREGEAVEEAPEVKIRWRSRSRVPREVREETSAR